MKITKTVVAKGKSFENEDGSWTKVNYELTAELDFMGEELIAKEAMVKILDSWLIITEEKPKKVLAKPLGQTQVTPVTETEWRETKNPDIEWCRESDADPRDVEKALLKKGTMWTLDDPARDLFIFRKKPKEENV